jgi:hypothetical protein
MHVNFTRKRVIFTRLRVNWTRTFIAVCRKLITGNMRFTADWGRKIKNEAK